MINRKYRISSHYCAGDDPVDYSTILSGGVSHLKYLRVKSPERKDEQSRALISFILYAIGLYFETIILLRQYLIRINVC